MAAASIRFTVVFSTAAWAPVPPVSGVPVSGCMILAISSPAVAPDAGFKVYPPKLLTKDDKGISFEQVIIPLSTNATTIPALTLTTFDARAGQYQTQTQGPYQLTFHATRDVDRSQQYRPTVQSSDPTEEDAATPLLPLREPSGSDPEIVAAHQAAAQAYKTGYAAAALDAYSGLEESGHGWLTYNRGVIQLAAGSYGEAIAELLRSRETEPRNTATGDALQRACQVASVALPDRPGRSKAPWRRQSTWAQSAVIATSIEGRLAPSDGARPLFSARPGEVVLIREQSGSWLSIQRGNEMGWVEGKAVIRLVEKREQPNR